METTKTSIRFYNGKPVRARWENTDCSWWYVATDLIKALYGTDNERRYWNTFKSRHPELSSFCRQLKITASDSKKYDTDCISTTGINTLIMLLPTKTRIQFANWINGMNDPLDEQSKRNAYELYDSSMLHDIEIGTVKGLQQIHAFLFGGLYDFAGKIRTKNISKGGFIFANCMFFNEIFKHIDSMPDKTIDEILDKYVEMNITHPFMEGNGRATRIWLDLLFKNRLNVCIDWQQIDKKDYLQAMTKSTTDSQPIKELIKQALTTKINDREIFMKGIDYSYYYEEIE